MFVSRNSTFLRFSLKTYITFQSCLTMLLLATSEVSFFTISICIFAMLTIIVPNISTSNVQTNCFRSTSQKFGKVLNSFALIFLILVIWQFKSFCIPAFLSVIFTMVVTLVFMLFIALIFNIYIKLSCIIGIFINFFIHIFIIFSVLFLEFIIFSRFIVFFSLAIILLWCVFVNISHVFCLFFTNCNDYNLSTGSAFFRVHTDIDKDCDCLQSNNNDFLNDLWLLFGTLFFSLKVWFNSRSNKKLRVLVISIVSVVLFLHKHRFGKEEKGWRVVTTHLLTKASR